MFPEFGHVDSIIAASVHGQKWWNAKQNDVSQTQDLHTMLEAMLDSHITLQNKGFVWDLCYRDNVCRSVEFVIFTTLTETRPTNYVESIYVMCTTSLNLQSMNFDNIMHGANDLSAL